MQVGSCALEIVAVDEHSWILSERLGSVVVSHGRMTFHGRNYSVSAPGGAPSTAASWERAIRQHLGIR